MYSSQVQHIRELVKKYNEKIADPANQQKRELWTKHYGRKTTQIPIIVNIGWHNTWVKEYLNPKLKTQDPLLKSFEIGMHIVLMRSEIGDDFISEPWRDSPMAFNINYGMFGEAFGLERNVEGTHDDGGAWKADHPLKDLDQVENFKMPGHQVNIEKTKENYKIINDAVGDLIEINIAKRPGFHGFGSDISTFLGGMRGIEHAMMDMCTQPDKLHRLLAFMRDAVLDEHQQAETAGDFILTSNNNQAIPYIDELEPPKPNSGPRKRSDIWGFCAAQEMTLISPQMHEEFIFQYQKPIYEKFGAVHYGCCEDLTKKIDMLRKLKNLKSIAVTPSADVEKCAEQIGTDYVISYRPSPTDMVCTDWDENRIRDILTRDLQFCKGKYVHICLKDVETLQGDISRLSKWTKIAREVIEKINV